MKTVPIRHNPMVITCATVKLCDAYFLVWIIKFGLKSLISFIIFTGTQFFLNPPFPSQNLLCQHLAIICLQQECCNKHVQYLAWKLFSILCVNTSCWSCCPYNSFVKWYIDGGITVWKENCYLKPETHVLTTCILL